MSSRWDGPGTTPLTADQFPIKTIHARVVEGPDRGKEATATEENLSIGVGEGNELTLTDSTVSRYHVELSAQPGGIQVIDHNSTNGTLAHGIRITRAIVKPGVTLKIGRSKIEISEGAGATVKVHSSDNLVGIKGQSQVMRRLMAKVESAAPSASSVLLIGESGTGKELIAEAIHKLSPRTDKPFVTVDCASLSPTLVASDLFGHERGAFTGAQRQHIGAFEQADGGTLFLDELGELTPDLQTTLLGVLERRRFRRLGGSDEVTVDVRVIAATHRDLRAEVNSGKFRLDLYYRLAVISLTVPPLRDRSDDVPLLIEHFARSFGHHDSLRELFSDDAMAEMAAYHWPGNVRELRNSVEVAIALGEESALQNRLPEGGFNVDDKGAILDPLVELPYREARAALIDQFELHYLGHLLERSGGNVSKASRMAKMDRSHLTTLLKRCGLR